MGTMKSLLSFAALFLVLASAAAQSETRRYLYLSRARDQLFWQLVVLSGHR